MTTAKPKKKRRVARFGLKLLLLLMFVASLSLAWFANELGQSRLEAKFIEKMDSWNEGDQSSVEYWFDYEGTGGVKVGKPKPPIGPKWIRSIFGQHVFSRIASLSFVGSPFYRESTATLAFDDVEELKLNELEGLNSLRYEGFYELKDLSSLQQLSRLETISVVRCENLNTLHGIEDLKLLETIWVIGHRSKLNDIRALDGLDQLRMVSLDVDWTFASQENWNLLATLPKLVRLHIDGNRDKKRDAETPRPIFTPGQFRPNPAIEVLTLEHVEPGLVDLGCVREMPKLHRLEIIDSRSLESLEGLQYCKNLEHLKIEQCPNLKDVSALEHLPKLKTLCIARSDEMVDPIPALTCQEIERLEFKGMHGFEDLEFLNHAKKLEDLMLFDCGLKSLKGLQHLKSLKLLRLDGSDLTTIGCDIVDAPLAEVDFTDCDCLIDLNGLENIKNLVSVKIPGCMDLKSLKGLSPLTRMKSLDLTNCRSLKNLNDLKSLSQLQHVILVGCDSLENVDGLLGSSALKVLDWSDCPLLDTEKVELLRRKFPSLDEWQDNLDQR